MGIVIRQSLKSSAATAVGALLGAISIIAASRLTGKQELGFARTFVNYGSVAGVLLMTGFNSALTVFIYRFSADKAKKAALTGLSFCLPVLVSLVVFGIYAAMRGPFLSIFQPADRVYFNRYFLWLPALSLLITTQSILEAFLMTEMKITVFTTVREVLLKGGNLLLILLYGFGLISYHLWIIGTVGSYAVANGILLWVAYRTGSFQVSLRWHLFSKKEVYEILHFAGYHALLGMTLYLVGFLDSMMLPPLDKEGLNATAIYTNALFIISVLQIPYRALTVTVMPVLTEAYEQKDTQKVSDIFHRSSQTILLAGLGMAILIIANIHKGVQLLGPGYEAVVPLVYILMIGRLMDAATGVNDQLLSISRYYRYSFYLSLLLGGLLVGVSRFLIPQYGVLGAAWASTISLTLFNLGKWGVVWAKTGLQPWSGRTLKMLLAAACALVPVLLIPEIKNWLADVALRSFLVVSIYVILVHWLRISADASTILRKGMSRVQKAKS